MIRPRCSPPVRQKGAVTIIAAILFLVIVGYGAVVALDMGSSEVVDTTLQRDSLDARFIAEAGLERAFQRFKSGVACAAVFPDGPYTLGRGSFSVTNAVLEGANCRVTVQGMVGLASRTMDAVATPDVTVYDFYEPFPSSADFATVWATEVVTKNEGSSGFSSQDCGGACSGAVGGSVMAETNATGQRDWFQAYRERAIPTLNTGSGLTVDVSLAYKKYHQGSRTTRQEIEIRLYDSSRSRETVLWSDTSHSNANNWVLVNQSVSLPSSRDYDRLRIFFNLKEFKFNQVQVWVDEITIATP